MGEATRQSLRDAARYDKEARPMMRRRRPLARAAMIGGTAAYVGHRAGQNSANAAAAEADQNARLEQLEQQQYAAPPPQQQYAPPPPQYAPPPPAGRAGRRRHGRRQPADRAREAPGRRRADARGVRRREGEAARVAAQKRARGGGLDGVPHPDMDIERRCPRPTARARLARRRCRAGIRRTLSEAYASDSGTIRARAWLRLRGNHSSAAITPGRVRLQMIQMSIAITRIDQNG